MDVLLIHGYNVTSTKTYGVLPQRLKKLGYNVKDVYLAKYVTLDNGVTLNDLSRAFQFALQDLYGKRLAQVEFACVTHSTGALVIRHWIDRFHADHLKQMPLTHLIMLAPPNYGSRLATLGKSRISRLRELIGLEPGIKILDSLELGSQFQWDLANLWVEGKIPNAPMFYPFVISGQWIDHKLWDVVAPGTYERGSDGVVRAAAANLNTQILSIASGEKPEMKEMDDIPFLITAKTSHSDTRFGIMGSIPAKGDHPVLTAIAQALQVKDRRAYAALASDFEQRTAALQKQEPYYNGTPMDRYAQLVFRVTDDFDNPITDYVIELMDSDERGDQLPAGFFADQHKNEASPEFFTYFVSYDRLSKIPKGKFGFLVQAAADTPLASYSSCKWIMDVDDLIRPNQTTLIHVRLKRRLNKNIFALTDNFSEQKISGKPGSEWFD